MRKQYARCIVLRLLGGFKIYTWLSNALETEFEPVRLIKESPRGSVQSIRHKATGQLYILRRFSGNAEVYARLLEYTCPNLPVIYEVAQQDGDNLVLEEFIQGDTLGFLLQDALFSPEETKKIVRQVCRALWVLHSIGAVHRDVKPENIILRGDNAVLIDFDAARFHKPENSADTQILGTTASPLRSNTACPSRISAQTSMLWASSSTSCSPASIRPGIWPRDGWDGSWTAAPMSIPSGGTKMFFA